MNDEEREKRIAAVCPSVAPRITPDVIKADMANVKWTVGRDGESTSTFAHGYLDGFYLGSGHSACVSPENFNEAIGKEIALGNAFSAVEQKLWELHGYYLKRSFAEGRIVLTGPALTLEPFKQRLLIEFGELNNRMAALEAYADTPAFEELDKAAQDLLIKQSNLMVDLRDVLRQRLAAMSIEI